MIPNLLEKKSFPDKLPKSLKEEIRKLKKSKSKKDCLNKAYQILKSRYKGCRLYTYLHIENLVEWDLESLWKEKGCQHCTKLNYLMRLLLVKSGFFKEKDIPQQLTLVYGTSLHQYLEVNVDDKWIIVDPWKKLL